MMSMTLRKQAQAIVSREFGFKDLWPVEEHMIDIVINCTTDAITQYLEKDYPDLANHIREEFKQG